MNSLESIVMMMIMSMMTPLITSATQAMTEIIRKLVDRILSPTPKVDTTYNSVELTASSYYNDKNSCWMELGSDKNTYELISSILQFLYVNKIVINQISCKLGDSNSNLAGDEAKRARPFEIRPKSTVYYDGFMISLNENLDINKEKGTGTSSQTILIKSKKSSQEINDFVRKCYDEYITRYSRESKEDSKPYIYKIDSSVDAKNINLYFNRYLLNNKVTFDDIFIPELDKIIKLADRFRNGQLNKLSLLLHGAPGCGKTSIIKSLSNYLGLSIIEIKLSTIKDDYQLNKLFCGSEISMFNGHRSWYIPSNKRIYVFEDIDAESDITHKRSEESIKKVEESVKKAEEDVRSSSPIIITYPGGTMKDTSKSDDQTKLTLAGILNAFDGIQELNSVIIMTTNHVAKLDPALIRSGRVTKAIELKKMTSFNASLLIKKYFGAHDIILDDYVITPADLDALCKTSFSLDELREAIKLLLETKC